MRRQAFCISLCLLLSVVGPALFAQTSEDVCPVSPDGELAETSDFNGERASRSKDFTVPRRQMLMEMITSVY